MTKVGRMHLVAWAACLWPVATAVVRAEGPPARRSWGWATASPESRGMNPTELEAAWAVLKDRHTTALLVVRHDRIVFERYAPGHDRTKPHYTASMAKALVGGLGLILAMGDGRIRPDDPASRYVPRWRDDPRRKEITVRHLATHTSGIENAEEGGRPHDHLTGWKGDFWKRLPPPHDPFTLARDRAPVLDEPGTRERYSNPGMAMLGYCAACLMVVARKGADRVVNRSTNRRPVPLRAGHTNGQTAGNRRRSWCNPTVAPVASEGPADPCEAAGPSGSLDGRVAKPSASPCRLEIDGVRNDPTRRTLPAIITAGPNSLLRLQNNRGQKSLKHGWLMRRTR